MSRPRRRGPAAAWAFDLVRPGVRVVCTGPAGSPGRSGTRGRAPGDVTAAGVPGGSAGLAGITETQRIGRPRGTVEAYAGGPVDARPLVTATAGPDDVLAGPDDTADVPVVPRPAGAGPGPKIHIDPRRQRRTCASGRKR